MDINDKMHLNASMARGVIINQVAMLEKLIDVYLSAFYAQKGKQNMFMLAFLSKTEIKRKVQIFKETIDKYDNSFKKRFIDYSSEFESILKMRNTLAHEVLDVSDKGILKFTEGLLSFDNFRANRVVTEYTTDDINKMDSLIQSYIEGIRKLLDE